MDNSPEKVTQILQAVGTGDPQAAEQLLPLVYDEIALDQDPNVRVNQQELETFTQA